MKNLLLYLLSLVPLIGICQSTLIIPDTLSGDTLSLELQNGQFSFFPGSQTNTIGYNQDILGPTLILQKDKAVTIHVKNSLSAPTTLHWHGLHVSSENDGGPHTVILPGQTWSPSFTILDWAATYWYHPHLHEHTEEQVTQGAAGFIIVRDSQEASLQLPRSYGVDDFPVVIQSRAFDANKELRMGTALDTAIFCNATYRAFLSVPAQVVRLRLLNGSTERIYNLGFQGNKTFYQIASDGSLLAAPVGLTRLRLSPGERAEILLNLDSLQGQNLNLMSFNSELPNGYYGATRPGVMPIASIPDYTNNPLNGSDFQVLQLQVGPATSNPVLSIPTSLTTHTPYPAAQAAVTRNLLFQPAQMGPTGMVNGPFRINGVSYDSSVINYRIPIDQIEIWELQNMTAIAHPFHIHDVQFYILDINGTAPPANMQGRKDVVLVPPMQGTVRFITKFEDFANDQVPYMYHCHMLSHEDEGMMGQFVVFDNTIAIDEQEDMSLSIYPNPVDDELVIDGLEPSTLELYDATGQLLLSKKTTASQARIWVKAYASGVYYLQVKTTKNTVAYKVLKK